MALYAGTNSFALQSGSEAETSPEGLVTVTETWRGKTSDRSTFIGTKPRGTACTLSGYTALLSIAAPRFTEEGAYSTAYIVYQGAPDGDGTAENDLDINHTDEIRTIVLNLSESGAMTWELAYTSPIVTASYIAGSKPTAFRFDGLISSDDPVQISATPKAGSPARNGPFETPAEMKIKTESKFVERRNVGGIWHCTEQHSKIITNLDGSS